jgi:hypothetical protein
MGHSPLAAARLCSECSSSGRQGTNWPNRGLRPGLDRRRACVRRTVAPEDGKSATLPNRCAAQAAFRTVPARHAKVVQRRPMTHARAAFDCCNDELFAR